MMKKTILAMLAVLGIQLIVQCAGCTRVEDNQTVQPTPEVVVEQTNSVFSVGYGSSFTQERYIWESFIYPTNRTERSK